MEYQIKHLSNTNNILVRQGQDDQKSSKKVKVTFKIWNQADIYGNLVGGSPMVIAVDNTKMKKDGQHYVATRTKTLGGQYKNKDWVPA